MTRPRRPLDPLERADLERFALRYVERYATTRGRLADYLKRKIRERGWGEETESRRSPRRWRSAWPTSAMSTIGLCRGQSRARWDGAGSAPAG
jgi:hypothetical protein